MNENILNDEIIAGYILGVLPEEQVERLDELTVVDPDFFQRVGAVENELVDRYVSGELPATELARFETYYLSSSDRRQKVQFSRAFQEYIGKKTAPASAASLVVDDELPLSKRLYFFLFGSRSLQWGLAATAIVLGLLSGWLYLQNSDLRGQFDELAASRDSVLNREQELTKRLEDERAAIDANAQEIARLNSEREKLESEIEREKQELQTESAKRGSTEQNRNGGGIGLTIAAFVLSPQLRGNDLPSLKIPNGTDRARITLDLESNNSGRFSVELKDSSSGNAIWSARSLRAIKRGDNASLTVSIPASLLGRNLYILTVQQTQAGQSPEIVGDYNFRVVR